MNEKKPKTMAWTRYSKEHRRELAQIKKRYRTGERAQLLRDLALAEDLGSNHKVVHDHL